MSFLVYGKFIKFQIRMVFILIQFQSMTDIFDDCAFYNLSNTSIDFYVSGD